MKITQDSWRAAHHAIQDDDEMIYDVAANCGQQVANVRHMTWFLRAVAEWLQDEAYDSKQSD